MERHVATAITFDYFHAALGQHFGRGHDIFLLGVASQSNDRSVFQQQQNIADAILLTQFDEALLQAQAGGVVEGAELEDGDQERLSN